MTFTIRSATSYQDYEVAAQLFREYATELDEDLSYQSFDQELANLPGEYIAPLGGILLTESESGTAIGCVALKCLSAEENICEIKRMYVRPTGRGMKLGYALLQEILKLAGKFQYQQVKLDTLPHLEAALILYRQNGFVEIDAYYDTPVAETVFMGRQL